MYALRQILILTSFLLLFVLKATNSGQSVAAPFEPYRVLLKLDAGTADFPLDGKEETTEWFKILDSSRGLIVPRILAAPIQQNFEFPHRIKQQAYLSVLLPPPKSMV
jgi:hypothetical protein